VQEKGLGDKVTLQDAFDLAKDLHVEDEEGVEDVDKEDARTYRTRTPSVGGRRPPSRTSQHSSGAFWNADAPMCWGPAESDRGGVREQECDDGCAWEGLEVATAESAATTVTKETGHPMD
jgi:hypothetical protein